MNYHTLGRLFMRARTASHQPGRSPFLFIGPIFPSANLNDHACVCLIQPQFNLFSRFFLSPVIRLCARALCSKCSSHIIAAPAAAVHRAKLEF